MSTVSEPFAPAAHTAAHAGARLPDPAAPGAGSAVDRLLRDPRGFLDRLDDAGRDPALARALLVAIALSAAVFGASLGLYRGGVQVVFAAVKLPLVVLLTAALAGPALVALLSVVRGRLDAGGDLALLLGSLALASLVLAALAPLMLLGQLVDLSYHALTLLAVACYGLAGAVGLALFARGVARRAPRGRGLVTVAVLLVAGLVGAQMAWTLRPWLVRPRTDDVPFVRALEGGFLEAIATSADSARGIYRRDAAPLPYDGPAAVPAERWIDPWLDGAPDMTEEVPR